MNELKKYELEWGGKTLTLETGQLAGLANASVKVQYGDTVVLVTACISKDTRDGIDYFPLMVDYKENLYAAGKISGSRFVKREGRPSDDAVLTGRLIDRSLRPLFDNEIRNDVQVMVKVLSIDMQNDPDIVSLIGAASVLMISDIPWGGPLAGCIVSFIDGEYILNPTTEQREKSELNLTLAARNNEVVMMEIDAKQAEEDKVSGAIEFGLKEVNPVIEFLEKIQKEIGKEKMALQTFELSDDEKASKESAIEKAKPILDANLDKMFGIKHKIDRNAQENEILDLLKKELTDEEFSYAAEYFDKVYSDEARKRLVEKEERVDGRKIDEIRALSAAIDILPKRIHGTALFNRGETQILSVVTLAPPGAEQLLDQMEFEGTKRFMHHYNFPGFSVGEVSPERGPGRREIGHGALAEKALEPVIPDKKDFPQTIRVVSEVLSSNGSSSQGSATCSSMALMAAGVPISAPVAGIAMGLMSDLTDPSKYKVLTDIQGVEDHAGDMDFKVAGTNKGITAAQLDISNVSGISFEICKETLAQAKKARLEILEVCAGAIAEPRKELSPNAPQVVTLTIDKEKIGELIGPGGKVINGIIEETGVSIDIEEDGTVFVTAENNEDMERGLKMVKDVTKEVKTGEVYEGEVMKIISDQNTGSDIGAIVQLTPNHDGMVHISQIANERVDKIADHIKEGETVKVQVMKVDKERGRIELSMKVLLNK
ncbi:MAG: polyribonucleotide nucleotidyltransferase [Patescibacteria group bacterium]